ncbi:substrate-binding domain-containing protein [Streptomyces sp. HMX112]|uniref:substrate-binding domain-containing protein n=1 Tax=Streptomyces sp. HMX112 TaxID=3390850 RepID=UPI003A7F7D09
MLTGRREPGRVPDRPPGLSEVLPNGRVVDGGSAEVPGRTGVERAVAEGRRFDCVFAHGDLVAGGASRAQREAGRGVPQDVAVAGSAGPPTARQTEPPPTTVRRPARQTGGTAARLPLATLADETLSAEPLALPTGPAVRRSAPRR